MIEPSNKAPSKREVKHSKKRSSKREDKTSSKRVFGPQAGVQQNVRPNVSSKVRELRILVDNELLTRMEHSAERKKVTKTFWVSRSFQRYLKVLGH